MAGSTVAYHSYLYPSKTSSDDAILVAIERASKTVRDMRWFKVLETRGHIEKGRIAHWQVTIEIGFTLEQ